MHEIKELISTLCQSKASASQLIALFAKRIRTLHGQCGVALLSTTGLDPKQCQITVYIDQQGELIFDHDHLQNAADAVTILTGQYVQDIIDFNEPRILCDAVTPLVEIFGQYFDKQLNIVSIPLYLQGKVNKWVLILFNRPNPLQDADIERIWLIATLAINYGFSEDNANKLREANQWIENELNAVARIQNMLLPQDLDNTPGLKVAAQLKPFAQVGGDYYDVTPLSSVFNQEVLSPKDEVWGFMVADASGHGSAAAVEIAMFDAILRTYPPNIEAGPAGVFNYVNRYLFTRTIRGGFISAFVSAYIPEEGVLNFCNAGHPAPFLKKNGLQNGQNASLSRLDESIGIPLGIIPDGEWTSASISFGSGDILVLFTDGVTEAKSQSGELFGEERLAEIILSSENDPNTILKNIEDALNHHQYNTKQSDDQTLLVVQPT